MAGNADKAADGADGRTHGWIVILGSLAALGGMMVHPTGGGRALDMVRSLVRDGGFNAGVHAFLIGVYLALILGFYGFSRRLGRDDPLVQGGFIAYVAGAFAAVAAAMSAGFVNRTLAMNYADATQDKAEYIVAAFRVSGAFNYAWGRMWVIAISVAILLWSIALLRRGGRVRLLGLFGILLGLAGAAGIGLGLLPLSVFALIGVIAGQTLWSVAVGALMVRRSL